MQYRIISIRFKYLTPVEEPTSMYLIKFIKAHTDYLPHIELISRDDSRLNIESR